MSVDYETSKALAATAGRIKVAHAAMAAAARPSTSSSHPCGRATETDRGEPPAVCGWPDLVMGTSTAWPHNLLTIPTPKSEAPPVVWMIACGDRE
jgi:hypothetical protein